MRVLLVSMFVEGQFGLIRYFERGLQSLDHETELFSAVPDALEKKAIFSGRFGSIAWRGLRRLQKARVGKRHGEIAASLRETLRRFKPDIALTTKGTGIESSLFDVLDKARVPFFNFYPDPIPEGDSNFVSTVPRYAGFFTYNRDQIPRLYWYGARQVEYLPFASDPVLHVPKAPPPEKQGYYKSPVAYLATWQPSAEVWPAKLAPFGLKIWGQQWDRVPPNHPTRIAWQGVNKGTYDELALVCSSTDVVFNMVRAHNGLSHSMKTFEIPACGAFMLTNRTEEQQSFFREGVEAEYFSTEDELIDKTRFYLRNEAERHRIASAGHAIALSHRYEHRMRDLVLAVQKHR